MDEDTHTTRFHATIRSMTTSSPSGNATRRDVAAVAFALAFPTLVTVMYFILLAKYAPALQQSAYGVGKTIQFLFPAVWVIWIQRSRPRCERPQTRDLATGAMLGLLLLVPALALYSFWLKPAGLFDGAAVAVWEKVGGFGIQTLSQFVAMAIFYCAAHSLMEEYYWRWFVFAQLRRLVSFPTAIIVSSLGFMAHHVFVLAVYFCWSSPLTWLFSLAVAAGGAIWAGIYEKTGSLYAPWLSHALVDTAIFIVGYDLLSDARFGPAILSHTLLDDFSRGAMIAINEFSIPMRHALGVAAESS